MTDGGHEFILWIEGVDFDRNLFDTNDLSTTRGASLALLHMPVRVEALLNETFGGPNVEKIFSGASQAAFLFSDVKELEVVEKKIAKCLAPLSTEGRDPESVRRAGKAAQKAKGTWPNVAPFAHLRFVWGMASFGTEGRDQALARAQARARIRQLREGGARTTPNRQVNQVCAIDRFRQADASVWVAADAIVSSGRVDVTRASTFEEEGDAVKEDTRSKSDQSQKIRVSRSVAARRHFGRWARQSFYASELKMDAEEAWCLGFADSLYDIVADPPQGTPLALRQKIAIFYADGNKFGKIRARLADRDGRDEVDALRIFSSSLLKLQRLQLLNPLVGAFREERRGAAKARYILEQRDRLRLSGELLRVETLLWGGDEVMFAVPAWLGWWLARSFFEWVQEWKIDNEKLTFAAGLVFASYKTPIRDTQRLAKELGDMAKAAFPDGKTSALEVEVLESVDPPLDGIGDLRKRLLGSDNARPLAIRAEEIEGFCARIAAFKRAESEDWTVPKSQVYRILRAVAGERLTLTGEEAGKVAREAWEAYRRRTGAGPDAQKLALTRELTGDEFFALNFHLLAQQWDYVDPFEDEIIDPSRLSHTVEEGTS